jgi:hypothetical protein
MRVLKGLLLTIATLIAAVVGGAVVSSLYGRLRYSHVPIEERDVFFDIGLVFFFSFVTIIAIAVVVFVLRLRKRRAISVTRARES